MVAAQIHSNSGQFAALHMSRSLIVRFGSSAFKLSTTSVVGVAHGLALLFGIGTEALPLWDPRMRRTNLRGGLTEAEPGGQYDLTSSIVPRGTSSHHVVERVFLPIAFGCLLSCGLRPVAGSSRTRCHQSKCGA